LSSLNHQHNFLNEDFLYPLQKDYVLIFFFSWYFMGLFFFVFCTFVNIL
jgi:hypothetical protein